LGSCVGEMSLEPLAEEVNDDEAAA
jgi:hypothetical protein